MVWNRQDSAVEDFASESVLLTEGRIKKCNGASLLNVSYDNVTVDAGEVYRCCGRTQLTHKFRFRCCCRTQLTQDLRFCCFCRTQLGQDMGHCCCCRTQSSQGSKTFLAFGSDKMPEKEQKGKEYALSCV